jgi:hypothetical protein
MDSTLTAYSTPSKIRSLMGIKLGGYLLILEFNEAKITQKREDAQILRSGN